MSKGDIIIDGGNSNWNDTIRRTAVVEEKGLLFIGAGVSGGEEGMSFKCFSIILLIHFFLFSRRSKGAFNHAWRI